MQLLGRCLVINKVSIKVIVNIRSLPKLSTSNTWDQLIWLVALSWSALVHKASVAWSLVLEELVIYWWHGVVAFSSLILLILKLIELLEKKLSLETKALAVLVLLRHVVLGPTIGIALLLTLLSILLIILSLALSLSCKIYILNVIVAWCEWHLKLKGWSALLVFELTLRKFVLAASSKVASRCSCWIGALKLLHELHLMDVGAGARLLRGRLIVLER